MAAKAQTKSDQLTCYTTQQQAMDYRIYNSEL